MLKMSVLAMTLLVAVSSCGRSDHGDNVEEKSVAIDKGSESLSNLFNPEFHKRYFSNNRNPAPHWLEYSLSEKNGSLVLEKDLQVEGVDGKSYLVYYPEGIKQSSFEEFVGSYNCDVTRTYNYGDFGILAYSRFEQQDVGHLGFFHQTDNHLHFIVFESEQVGDIPENFYMFAIHILDTTYEQHLQEVHANF